MTDSTRSSSRSEEGQTAQDDDFEERLTRVEEQFQRIKDLTAEVLRRVKALGVDLPAEADGLVGGNQ